MLEQLTPCSRQMAEDLLAAFPHWRIHLRLLAGSGDNGAINYEFMIEVPPPAGARGGPLQITSAIDEEITVIYAAFHRHFASLDGDTDQSESALAFIQALQDEQLVIVSYICTGDPLIKDGPFASHCLPANGIPCANYEYPYATSMQVRSWRGSHDADFAAPYGNRQKTDSAIDTA